METQTFQAREMKEALALVRRQLGPNAVIVNTRRVTNGPLGLLGGSFVEVSAYADPEDDARDDNASTTASTREAKRNVTTSSNASGTISSANYHKVKMALSRAKR